MQRPLCLAGDCLMSVRVAVCWPPLGSSSSAVIIIKVVLKRKILSLDTILSAHTYIRSHARTHERTHTHARTHTHSRTHRYTHACSRTHACTRTHTHTHAHTYTHSHTRTLSCVLFCYSLPVPELSACHLVLNLCPNCLPVLYLTCARTVCLSSCT